jgi:hypothetical protein
LAGKVRSEVLEQAVILVATAIQAIRVMAENSEALMAAKGKKRQDA